MLGRRAPPLSSPQPKAGGGGAGGPLPVPISSLTGLPASNTVWAVWRGAIVRGGGSVQGRQTTVQLTGQEAHAVHRHGCFGTLVEGGLWDDQARPVCEEWQPGLDMKPCAGEEELLQDAAADVFSQPASNTSNNNRTEPSSWAEMREDFNHDGGEEKSVVLELELCEAFFLSYCLGCLLVRDGNGELSLLEQWQLYCRLEDDFVYRYRVYLQFRARGWVVRPGYCLGADWLLYKLGPAHYHASYLVRVEGAGLPRLGWADLLGHARTAGNVKKEVLVARVEVAGGRAGRTRSDTPDCLAGLAVVVWRTRRWLPGDQRWLTKPPVPIQHGADNIIVLD